MLSKGAETGVVLAALRVCGLRLAPPAEPPPTGMLQRLLSGCTLDQMAQTCTGWLHHSPLPCAGALPGTR